MSTHPDIPSVSAATANPFFLACSGIIGAMSDAVGIADTDDIGEIDDAVGTGCPEDP